MRHLPYWLYKLLMKAAHRFNWHYAPPIYQEGDTQLWCKWCGFRQTVKRRDDKPAVMPNIKLTGGLTAESEKTNE